MPDILDFATACPDKSYKEQVMEKIRQEAESYGMTVEAYAANGYEPPKGAADKIRKGGGVLAM